MKISLIGGGNMATALLGGLVAKGSLARDFRVVEPFPEQRDKLVAKFPGVGVFAAPAAAAVEGADLVVLAVKPQQMRAAAEALSPFVAAVPVVMTIAAGMRIADLSRWLGGYARIVRAMPNTPALVGAGISGVYAPPAVDAAARRLATHVLEAAGEVLWVEREDMLDAVTGVSGSGPAYVFYFLEGLEEGALALGFARADARRLAYATFAGAIKLALSSDLDPAVLRAQVTSKNGTTERALTLMEAEGVKAKVVAAVAAAALRARELGDELGKQDR